MTERSEPASGGPTQRWVEGGVAVLMAVLGVIIIIGSMQVGIGWGPEGPKSGFFPFYLGVTIIGASAANLVRAFIDYDPDQLFADWGQLTQVMAVVIPTTVYVLSVPWLGLYLASMLLIGVFMKWLGRYGWGLTLAIAIGVPAVAYVIFEKWFLIPLPKGPIEDLLGL